MSCRSLDRAMRQVDRGGKEFCVSRQDFLAVHVGGPTKTVVGGGRFRRWVEKRGWQKCRNKVLRDLIRPRREAAGDTWRHGPSHLHECTAGRRCAELGKCTMVLIEIKSPGISDAVAQSHAD